MVFRSFPNHFVHFYFWTVNNSSKSGFVLRHMKMNHGEMSLHCFTSLTIHDFELESFYDNLKTFKWSFLVAFSAFGIAEALSGLEVAKTLITSVTLKISSEICYSGWISTKTVNPFHFRSYTACEKRYTLHAPPPLPCVHCWCARRKKVDRSCKPAQNMIDCAIRCFSGVRHPSTHSHRKLKHV